jgi:hypothetical protein
MIFISQTYEFEVSTDKLLTHKQLRQISSPQIKFSQKETIKHLKEIKYD